MRCLTTENRCRCIIYDVCSSKTKNGEEDQIENEMHEPLPKGGDVYVQQHYFVGVYKRKSLVENTMLMKKFLHQF